MGAPGRGGVNAAAVSVPVPHYAQTLDFTCGPSSLLMVMKALEPDTEFTRTAELLLWKEATTMFMGGPRHGGSNALGLAIAADRRGFETEVVVSHAGVLLADRGRSKDRREVMRLLHEADLAEAGRRGIPIAYREIRVAGLEEKFRAGWLPMVLVTTLHVHGDDVAHWVVVTGFGPDAVYINDPWVDRKAGKVPADMTNLRIAPDAFDRMATVGRQNERAIVFVRRRDRATPVRETAPMPTAEVKRHD